MSAWPLSMRYGSTMRSVRIPTSLAARSVEILLVKSQDELRRCMGETGAGTRPSTSAKNGWGQKVVKESVAWQTVVKMGRESPAIDREGLRGIRDGFRQSNLQSLALCGHMRQQVLRREDAPGE